MLEKVVPARLRGSFGARLVAGVLLTTLITAPVTGLIGAGIKALTE